MRKLTTTSLALALTFTAASAMAANVTIGLGPGGALGRSVTPEESGDANGPPAEAKVYEFIVTSDADILRVGDVFIDTGGAGLYNNATGSNTAPPNPAFVAVFPSLGADSWITTPGAGTSTAGGDLGDDNASWFDTTNDGPVTDFTFARLTTTGALNSFRGVISVAGSGGPEVFPFNITFGIPEPTSLALFGVGVVGLALAGRRRQ